MIFQDTCFITPGTLTRKYGVTLLKTKQKYKKNFKFLFLPQFRRILLFSY